MLIVHPPNNARTHQSENQEMEFPSNLDYRLMTMLSGPLDSTASAGSSYGFPSMWLKLAGTKIKSPGPPSTYSL